MNYQAKANFAQNVKSLHEELSNNPSVAQKLKESHPFIEVSAHKKGFGQEKGGWPTK